MNYTEIVEKLNELSLTPKEMGKYVEHGECYIYDDGKEENIDIDSILSKNFGKYDVVDRSGFYDGYDCYVIYSFYEHNVFLKCRGFYSSYDDTHWKYFVEVLPEQKTITIYNDKR